MTEQTDRAHVERCHSRSVADHLALVHRKGEGQVLCRLRDLGESGARICLSPRETGPVGTEVELVLLEAGLSGANLTISSRVAWVRDGEVGLNWEPLEGPAKSALRRVLLASDTRQLLMVG